MSKNTEKKKTEETEEPLNEVITMLFAITLVGLAGYGLYKIVDELNRDSYRPISEIKEQETMSSLAEEDME